MKKYSIRQNKWDNWNGYLGTRKIMSFSNGPILTAEQDARTWLENQQCLQRNAPLFKCKDDKVNELKLALQNMVDALRSGRLAWNTTPPCYEILSNADKALKQMEGY